MLDRDLAELYETETRTLKQAVKRNAARFPSDFMFELSDEDIDLLVSQSVIPSKKHLGGAVPYAFTEQGVSMLSSILRTPLAVEISIRIMRAFVSKLVRKAKESIVLIDNYADDSPGTRVFSVQPWRALNAAD